MNPPISDHVTLPCYFCNTPNSIPLYANIGRCLPHVWFCSHCHLIQPPYKRFYGCQTMTEALHQIAHEELHHSQ